MSLQALENKRRMNMEDEYGLDALIQGLEGNQEDHHYQQAHAIIQHLMVKHEQMTVEDKILQLKLVHSHLNYVRHFHQRKELALALAKYAVSDTQAVLTVGVHFPENTEGVENEE